MTSCTKLSPAAVADPAAEFVAELAGVEVGFRCDGRAKLVGVALDLVAAGDGAVADGGAFFVGGEEGGFLEAGPQGFALGGEGFDGVEVGAEFEGASAGMQPLGPGWPLRGLRDDTETRARARRRGTWRCG